MKQVSYIFITMLLLLASCDTNKKPYVSTYETTAESTVAESITVFENQFSDNMFDKSSSVKGQIFYHSSSGPELIVNAEGFFNYVKLSGAGTYRTKVSFAYHGEEYALRVPLLDENKSFLKNVNASVVDSSNPSAVLIEFEITEFDIHSGAFYMAYDGDADYMNSLMIVKDMDYPTKYIPYGETDPSNLLSGKTAIFLGDSICAGKSVGETLPEYRYGWAGLIGEANQMGWGNFGRNGAVITSGIENQTRIVTDQLDDAALQYEIVDYILLEGGTNDADELDDYPEKIGVVSDTNFTDFDTTTFSGAFEALIYKTKSIYPDAKIGYIIPPKMGNGPYESDGNPRRQYFDRAIEICEKWDIPYIDLWADSTMDPSLSEYYDSSLDHAGNIATGKCYIDGQHLTLTGYNQIVPLIEEFIRNL